MEKTADATEFFVFYFETCLHPRVCCATWPNKCLLGPLFKNLNPIGQRLLSTRTKGAPSSVRPTYAMDGRLGERERGLVGVRKQGRQSQVGLRLMAGVKACVLF
eukprot:scaffold27954_cov96-Isochrysis_galbana.AAC.1